MRWFSCFLGTVMWLVLATRAQGAISLEQVVDGSSQGVSGLVYAASPNTDSLYLIQQNGQIKLFNTQSRTTTTIVNLNQGNFVSGGELGLLGIAFDPKFNDSQAGGGGYYYVNTTERNAQVNNNRVYSRITRLNRYDSNYRQTVIDIPKNLDQTNHNAGWLGFGKDGMLYVGTGDGGSGGDPTGNAQNGNSLLGKILRLDVSNPTVSYAIPSDNPFANGNGGANAGFRDEIWASGLRNPFRAGFDSKTGDLYVGDVGQGAWEEIDRLQAGVGGMNFGWNFREGAHPYQGSATAALTDPIYEYDHSQGRSVIGGTVFRGGGELDGWYLFSDFYNGGKVWALPVDVDCSAPGANCPAPGSARLLDLTTTSGTLNTIAGFSTDAVGNLYITDYDGDVFRVNAAPVPIPAAFWMFVPALAALLRLRRPASGFC